jgi:hypothetical protein
VNVYLLCTPLLLTVLLYTLQHLINTLLSDSEAFQCGCKCLACCDWAAEGNRPFVLVENGVLLDQ